MVITVTEVGKNQAGLVGVVCSGCHSQCPGVLGLNTQTSHEAGAGTTLIVTEGGIVITVRDVGTMVFGPIVITIIELGM